MSRKTTLCIVNSSGQAINSMSVSGVAGFEDNSSFKSFLPKGALPDNSSFCGYLEIANSGPAPYTLKVTFVDGTDATFSADQAESLVKCGGEIKHRGSAAGITIYRTCGGNVSASYGTSAIHIRTVTEPDHSNWMGEYLKTHPQASLNQMCLPGSHDAGMYKTTYFFDITTESHPEWVLTQNRTIGEQLVAGARYFDLRVRADQGTLCAAHWSDVLGKRYGALGPHLNDVLDDVVDFLKNKGMKEVVILKFSHGSDADLCGKVVKRVKDIVGDLLYNPQGAAINLATSHILHTTKLSEMAGKVVAVFGGDGDGYDSYWKPIDGIFPYFDMPEDGSTANVSTPMSRLYVYDRYAGDGVYEKMVKDQDAKLQAYGGLNNVYLFLLSWTLSGGGAVSDIEVLAGMAKPWLPQYLSGITKRPNIVFTDFVDPYTCSAIIAANRP
jgi:1-phosphatidylinositol phosphodiesterase